MVYQFNCIVAGSINALLLHLTNFILELMIRDKTSHRHNSGCLV